MARLLPALLLGLLLPACYLSRPASLARWNACITDSRILPPTFHLGVRWDDTPPFYEYSAAQLSVALGPALAAGTVIPVSARTPASYLEGSQDLFFESHTLTGTIRVLHDGSSSAELALDLRAVSPTIDVEQRGSFPLKGVVRAIKKTTCY